MKEMHVKYMRRCLELAQCGFSKTAPNPMVGSLIVCDGKIIGEGYHQKYGENHAEINAINSVKNKELLPKSTLYVNLEPCAHFGKTPPCSDAIIRENIREVVIGAIDNNSLVAGKGVNKLKSCGINVVQGILENECRELNKRFYCFHERKRPFIILKWAQTKDGFLDKIRQSGETGINWITGETERRLVHKWRSEEQAIITGTNTIKIDNPSLTTRYWLGKSPLRIVLDKNKVLFLSSAVFSADAETLVFTENTSEKKENIEYIKTAFDKNILKNILNILYERDVQSLIVEGGASLLNSFIQENLWDEARIFIGEKYFREGVSAPVLLDDPDEFQQFQTSQLFTYRNKHSLNI